MTNNKPLIEWQEEILSVGIARMDETHREFIDLVNQLGMASDTQFHALFKMLLEHTVQHFKHENIAMEKSGFPPIIIHRNEHFRVLDKLKLLLLEIENGELDLARAFVCKYLPRWFPLHAETMDRALANHLKMSAMAGS